MTHVIPPYIIAMLLTGALADTTTTTWATPTEPLNLTLTGYDDHFYAVSATIGFPGWNFLLTFDPTISGIVVAHKRFVGSNRTNRFDPGLSGSFQSVANYSDRMYGMETVNTASYTIGSLDINILLNRDPTDTEFQAFFSQPFDGLYYEDYTDTYAQTALISTLSDIVLPQAIFSKLKAVTKAKLEGEKYVVECNVTFDQLTFTIDNVTYPLEFAYLVDQYGDECVLRVRPFDVDIVKYCDTTCSGYFANLCPTMKVEGVLGLPFLHRYCVRYDHAQQTSRIGGQKNILKDCDYGPRTTMQASTSSTLLGVPSSGPPVVIIVVATLSSFLLALVVGVAWIYYRQRNRRRMIKLMRALEADVPRPYSTTWNDYAESYPGKPTSKEEMQRELGLMRDLGRHPHVVNLVGYVPLQTPLLVLEYCAKGDLLGYLRDQLQGHKEAVITAVDPLQVANYSNTEISLKDLISLCWQISDGMTYLSSKGYVHRDLAARNILLTENMVAKISDFGLCRFTNEDLYVTYHGAKMPVRWLPPEALSTANFSSASDVWSYAVLLFEIFSAGRMPYAELQAQDVLVYLQVGGRLEQPTLCPADVYDLMKACWHDQPSDRPTFQTIRSFFSERLEYLSQGYGYLPLDDNSYLSDLK
ncbi:Protein F09A5.2 [Aphelenchoides avenae]|nr:Protein F09A5.2 [Aphelenchus avenae]